MALSLGEEVMLVPNLIIESQKLVLMIENKNKFTAEDIQRQAGVVQEKINAFASS